MLVDDLRLLAQDIYDTPRSGFDEVVYQRAFEVGLRLRNIPNESQRVIPVFYKGFHIGDGRPDLVVGETSTRIVIELKAVESVGHKEHTQIENYLQVLGIPNGLLINFSQPTKSKPARDNIEFIEIPVKEEAAP